MKITYYCAMSSDGFIAREDGDVSWLDEMEVDESESSYESFFASVDGLAMGRATYDFVFDYGSWPYGALPTWVFTNRPLQPLDGANLQMPNSVDDFLLEAKAAGMQHIWLVGGGKLASSFLDREILTDISITRAPFELAGGIPLFSDHKLQSIESIRRHNTEKKGCQQLEIVLRE